MFTGLIETVGKVASAARKAGGIKLAVECGKCSDKAKPGDSIAINGACLTVTALRGAVVEFDVSEETLSKTTLNNIQSGALVNIERAMQASDRFGGHFVQGHVDAVGKVKAIEKKGDFWRFIFQADDGIKGLLVPKGSIAIDGVSLTIAEARGKDFSVAIIPATFENTTFKNYKPGDEVNIETDIICRIIKKQLDNILPGRSGVTIDKLKEMGF